MLKFTCNVCSVIRLYRLFLLRVFSFLTNKFSEHVFSFVSYIDCIKTVQTQYIKSVCIVATARVVVAVAVAVLVVFVATRFLRNNLFGTRSRSDSSGGSDSGSSSSSESGSSSSSTSSSSSRKCSVIAATLSKLSIDPRVLFGVLRRHAILPILHDNRFTGHRWHHFGLTAAG